MEVRTRAIFSLSVAVGACLLAGCGYAPQQSRFQMAFLPPVPPAPPGPGEAFEPPVLPPPNPYLKNVPAFLTMNPQALERKGRADALAQQAERAYRRGRVSYSVQDVASARREYDSAVDLMLEALGQNPIDRKIYERRLDEMVEAIHRSDLSGMGASVEVEEGKFEKAPLEDILEMTFPVDPRLKDKVREQVAATVSQLPLSVTDDVLGYINYFNNRGRRTLISGLQRSGRYRPMIQRILDEEGVPQELIYLAQAESGFMPRAISRAAAGGMWQFLAWRGKEYGLERTATTDDRMDPEKATRAAARHLRDLYAQFGDWYLAIAAYNCGPVTVERAVERTGYADFWELRRRAVLPRETTNYVPIILAMTIIQKNPEEYGIAGVDLEPPLEYDTIALNAPTSLTLISDIVDAPLSEISAINPGVLKSLAPAGYAIHAPKGTGAQLLTALELIPAESRNAWRVHHVAPGETLEQIGKRYGSSPATIASANRLGSHDMVEGDRLLIPAVYRPEPEKRTVTRKASTHRAARSKKSSSRSGATASGKSKPAATKSAKTTTRPRSGGAATVARASAR